MNKYCGTILTLSLLVIIGFCICYHIHMSNIIVQHLHETVSIAPKYKSIELDELLFDVFSKHQKFNENYYQIQNNWLNLWLLITGLLITITTVVTPLMYAKKWDDERRKLEKIVEETNIKTIIEKLAEYKERYIKEVIDSSDQAVQEVRNIFLESEQRIETLTTKAEKNIKESKDVSDLSLNIKNELVEDIKSGVLKDIIFETIREDIEKILEDKQIERE